MWLVCLEGEVVVQLALLLTTNALYVGYVLYFRPYINTINTLVTPLMVSTLLFIESYMLYFYKNDAELFADQKT